MMAMGMSKIARKRKEELIGIGIEPDVEIKIKKMLSVLKELGKRLLVAIDEVTNSSDLRAFASAYQIFLYEGYPFFLIMTGLYDNVRSLQNEKSLTFLYRAPKIYLEPLNINAIANSYRETFNISTEEEIMDVMEGRHNTSTLYKTFE